MSFTARVGSADEVLTSMFVNFQIVGDAHAVRAMTENQSIRWMVKKEVFHEIPQYGFSRTLPGTTNKIGRRYRPPPISLTDYWSYAALP